MKRPWLAAGLAVFMTGLGHVYLHRWLRGLSWLGLALLASLLFVPESALTPSGRPPFWEVAPLVLVGVISVIDAYLLAQRHNVRRQVRTAERCPECYQELDTGLSFCPWCATDLPRSPE